ncbi:sigma-54-dependent Fis family transcriptional regulator [bacterium]|nr:sigma-54-dependent Fis family transcriptional regulator [candidate division CSSED10-310 bacterium]
MLNPPKFITHDPKMLQILKLVRQVAKFSSSLLIIGDSGTGKDLLAKLYHYFSPRRESKFVKVDCVSISKDLIESELFGHEKGAFSGAVVTRIGKFELAGKGSIYLDRVEELPTNIQTKLSRVLQEKVLERLGSNEQIPVNTQIVSSTQNDLASKIKNGKFREDLYFRLSIVPIKIPPLRSRKGDIPILIKHFFDSFSAKYKLEAPKLHPEVLEMLCNYHWPGNVRELENLVERLLISYQHQDEITADQIHLLDETFSEESLDSFADRNLSLTEIEKFYIKKILRKTKGNKTIAANILGINRKTLLEKRRKYDLE